jgi:pilus assembly protein CpaB
MCVGFAALSVISSRESAPAPGATVSLVIAARDLFVGAVLSADDVRLAQWPAALAPRRRITAAGSAIGRRMSTELSRGDPVTTASLVGHDLTAGLSPDHVATSVVTTTDVSVLVHAGDHVDLLAPPATADIISVGPAPPATVLARDVQVLAVLPGRQGDLAPTTQLIVATTHAAVLVLAGAPDGRVLAVVGRSP